MKHDWSGKQPTHSSNAVDFYEKLRGVLLDFIRAAVEFLTYRYRKEESQQGCRPRELHGRLADAKHR